MNDEKVISRISHEIITQKLYNRIAELERKLDKIRESVVLTKDYHTIDFKFAGEDRAIEHVKASIVKRIAENLHENGNVSFHKRQVAINQNPFLPTSTQYVGHVYTIKESIFDEVFNER